MWYFSVNVELKLRDVGPDGHASTQTSYTATARPLALHRPEVVPAHFWSAGWSSQSPGGTEHGSVANSSTLASELVCQTNESELCPAAVAGTCTVFDSDAGRSSIAVVEVRVWGG